MFDASDKTAKKKIEVEVELDDGKCLTGSLSTFFPRGGSGTC